MVLQGNLPADAAVGLVGQHLCMCAGSHGGAQGGCDGNEAQPGCTLGLQASCEGRRRLTGGRVAVHDVCLEVGSAAVEGVLCGGMEVDLQSRGGPQQSLSSSGRKQAMLPLLR